MKHGRHSESRVRFRTLADGHGDEEESEQLLNKCK